MGERTLPAVYRSADPIDNLILRVTLRRLATPAAAAAAAAGGPAPAAASAAAAAAAQEAEGGEVTADIAWQQKIYSPRELLAFADKRRRAAAAAAGGGGAGGGLGSFASSLSSSSSSSSLASDPVTAENERDMERRLLANEPVFEGASALGMLFTYVDADNFVPPELLLPAQADEAGGAGAGTGAHAPAGGASSLGVGAFSGATLTADGGGGAGSALADAVLAPHAQAHRAAAAAAGFREHPFQTMYVMAAIGVDEEAFRAQNSEAALARATDVCLCVVRAYRHSTLLEASRRRARARVRALA